MDTQALEASSGWRRPRLSLDVRMEEKMKKSHAGLSALDILITVLVLSVLLLAAAYQFGAYDGLSAQPTAQSDETQE